MAGQNRINFEVDFQVNSSNLQKLQSELRNVTTSMNHARATNTLTKELEEAGTLARKLGDIIDTSFNKDLGTMNVAKFNKQLKETGIDLSTVQSKLTSVGSSGINAWNRLSGAILSTNVQIKQSSKLLNDMATTMVNTMKWGVASSVLNTMTNSIRSAYNYSRQLDTSLTDIRIVTGDSAEQMGRFAEQANNAAKALGSNTLDYAKTALGYYQQGLGDEEVANRTEATIKAANVTGSQAAQVAEYLTAVWNGFQVGIGEETAYVDKLAAVADSSASNLAELATAMSKVASVANNMGVDMDQLNAQISTIIATTRQAPETVGNALKTIYARINDIKTGSDDAEISLGNYTGKMASLGIQVLDATGHLRDTGDVMEEIGSKWGSMGREQQIYLAQTMAGQRQMNNLIALFDNWNKYTEMLNVSMSAQGTLEEKNARYLESTQAHLNTLKSTWQDLYSTLLDTGEINTGIDLVTSLVQVVDDFLEGFGGGIKSLTALGTVGAFVFRDQIGNAIGQAKLNAEAYANNLERLQLLQQTLAASKNAVANGGTDVGAVAYNQTMVDYTEKMLAAQAGLTQEQAKTLNGKIQTIAAQEEEIANLKSMQQSEMERLGLTEQQLATEDNLAVATTQIEAAQQQVTRSLQESLWTAEEQGNVVSVLPEIADAVAKSTSEEVQQQYRVLENLIDQNAQEEVLLQTLNKIVEAQRQSAGSTGDQTSNVAAIGQQIAMKERLVAANKEEADSELHAAQVRAQSQARTTAFTSSLMILTTTIGTISSLYQTLSNPDSTGMEKFTRVIMTLGGAIPMLIMSVGQLSKSLVTLGIAQGTTTKEIFASTIASAKQVIANTAEALSAKAVAAAEAYRTEVMAATTLGTGALTGQTLGLAAALNVLLGPVGLVILALGAIGVACYAAAKSYDAQTEAARKATQAAHDAKEKATELSDGYRELKTSLDELQNARSTLDGLKEGTQEWKEAVLALNEQVLALLDKYPELAKYLHNDNGVLTIDEKGIDAVLNDQLAKAQAAQDASISAQANASKQQGLVEAEKLGRDAGVNMSPEKIYEAAQIFSQNMGAIMDSNANHAQEFADRVDGMSEKQAAALLENTQGLLALNTTAQGIEALEDNRASNALSENKDYQNSEYKDAIDAEYQKRWDEIETDATQRRIESDMSKEALASLYEEMTGITYSAEELKNISKDTILENIENYRKAQQLAEQENDIIRAGEEAGKKAEESMSAFEQYGQQLIDKFSNETPKADEENYGKVKSATESVGEDGVLSGEDNITAIQGALATAGRDMDEFFTKMPDGTYKLKTTAEEFKNAMERISAQPFIDEADALQKKIEGLADATRLGELGLTSQQSSQEGQESQLNFLAAAGYEDQEQLGMWRDQVADGTMSEEDMRALTDAVKDYINQYPRLKAELSDAKDRAKELGEELNNMAHRDEEIDTEDLEKLSNYLEQSADKIDDLADGLDSADYDEVAESLLRYKDAVEEINENYDDWLDTLENGDIMDQAETIDEMRDAMGDLLDLPYDSLSDDFITNAENMDLMRRAAEGDEEAYNELAEAAGKDILAQVGIDDAQFEADKANIISQIESFTGQDWDDIEVGAELNDANFLAALTDMVNAAGMTADQATDYLSSMGVDAKVIEKKVPKENKQELLDVVPHIDSIPAPVPQIAADGSVDFTNVPVPIITFEGRKSTATAVSQEGVTSLEVTAANKKSGGGFKYQNAGGGSKSGGGGGGGGKKGGGGGGKAVKPPKKTEVKKDPYHDVNDQLKEVEHNLKTLQKEEKKLTGKQYLQNLIKQNQQLEKQRRLVGRKSDIAQAQMSERLTSMQREFGNIFSVDSEGYLTNYVELQKEAARQVEAAWQQANKSPSEENNQKYEYAKERYDKLTKAMDDYTKEVETFWKLAEEDQELVNQLIENNIKRFNYTIDLHLDTAEFEQNWKEFRRDVLKGIKEDDYVNLSGFGLSMAKDDLADSKELVSHIKEIQTAITNMNKGKYNLSPYHDDFASAYADLRKYTEELMKKGEDIADVQKEIKDNWMDAIDDAQDAFDEQLDDYGKINDLIEHNLDMLEMLHGDEAYEQAARLYQQQANNSKQQLDFLKRETDFWKQQMDNAERGSDAWKEYKKNWEDSLQEMNKTVEDAADYFYKKYEATFNKLIKQMKDVFAGGDWNKRQTAWEDYLDEDDRYLDSLSRANGTYNVILKAQQAIGDASLKHQKELNKWLEATKDNLEGQTELRQIDLDIAEKELDIILKRQALEDAQNNKTKMRLRRDSQGNYRYQYVADTNKVAEAQQELRDAIEDLRLLVKDDFKDTVGRMYDQIDEFAEQAAEIAEKYGFESTEFAEGMADLQERYINKTTKTANDLAEMLTKLTQTTGVEATVLFDQMGDDFQAALGMNSETFAVFKEMFAPGGQYVNMIDGFVSSIYTGALSAMPDQVQDAFNGMTNLLPSAVADLGGNLQERIRGIFEAFQSDMSDAQSQYSDDISGLASQTGENFNDLTTSMESNITATQNLLTTNGKLIDSYGSVIETLESLSGEMDKVMDQYRDLSEATVNNTAKTFLSNGYYQNGTTGVGQTDYGISNFDSQYDNIDSISQALYLLSGANNFNLNDGTIVDGSGLSVSGLDAATSGYINYIQQIGEMAGTNSAAYSQLLNDYAQTISDQMSNLLGSIGMSNIMNLLTHASGDIDKAIEQAITINADFPNAESAAEIRQALEELINLASQRASGTRRTY